MDASKLVIGTAGIELPSKRTLDACRRCELWEHATQGVPGQGPDAATIAVVGEQPGDQEDFDGRPFVGPAGRLLRSLFTAAGIDSETIYLTNAVKHFSWQLRGKRRLHKTPLQRHIDACRPWLAAEMQGIKPKVVVTLGRTALAAILGRSLGIGEARGQRLALGDGTPVVATFHPSALLRAIDASARAELEQALLSDLQRAAAIAASHAHVKP